MSKIIEKNVYFENEFTVDMDYISKMLKRTFIPYMRAYEITGFISIAAAVAFVLTFFISGLNKNTRIDTIFWVAAFFVIIWILTKAQTLPAIRIRRAYKSLGGKDVGYHCTFDDDALMMFGENGMNDAITYYNINGIVDDTDAFVLRVNSTVIIRIPKDSFTYGSPDDFCSFIQQRTLNSKKASNNFVTFRILYNIIVTAWCMFFAVLMIMMFMV